MLCILVTVLTPVPERPGLCAWCARLFDELGLARRAAAEAGPGLPEESGVLWRQLVLSAERLTEIHLGRLRVRFLSPATPLGVWYILRNRIRRFPAFIFPDGQAVIGWNPEEVEARIDELVARPG